MPKPQPSWIILPLVTILALVSGLDHEALAESSLAGQTASQNAEAFAPGVLNTDAYEFALTFNPDMTEVFFTRRVGNGPNRILTSKILDGQWSEPTVVPFSQSGGPFEPFLSLDGQRLFFGEGLEIKYCDRMEDGWGPVQTLPEQINGGMAMSVCVDAENNYYFTRGRGLVVVHAEGDSFSDPQPLDPLFNGPAGDAAHGFLTPDAGILLFDAQGRPEVKGRADLYVSFKDGAGNWGQPRNMEALNTEVTEMCPSLSPDGRFLFFCRDGELLWVDAAVIEQYR